MPIASESDDPQSFPGSSSVDISITRTLILATERLTRGRELAAEAGGLGHDARVAESPQEAVHLVAAGEVDILVLFVEPGQGRAGRAFVSGLRHEYPSLDLQIVVVAEGTEASQLDELFEAGADDGVLWPEERSLVARRLRRADAAVRRKADRERLADELRGAERQLERIFQQSPCAILIARDGDGCILKANVTSERVLGMGPEELAGKPLSLLFPDLFVNRQGALSLDGWVEDASPLEVAFLHPTEGVRELELLAAPVSWDGEQEIVLQITDVAARKELERDRIKASKAESISQLAGGVAHDFNNILTAIMGNIALLNAEGVHQTAQSRDLLNRAEAACEKARLLANQLATFAREGKTQSALVDLGALLRKSVHFSLFGGETVPHFRLPEGVWPVYGDEAELSQVVAGIVLNADEAMASRGGGGGHLHVTATNVSVPESTRLPLEAGDYVRVAFKDNGCGIDAANMQRIFDPYFSTKHGHSGLGLATASTVVRGHGGHLRAESAIGQGTLIEIYLPAMSETDLFCEQVESRSQAGEGVEPVAEGPPVRVLFMDDDAEVREVVEKILTRHGFEVYCTQDGREAIEVYERAQEFGEPFEVLLFDLDVRGGLGGKEAIQYFRGRYPDIRALVCTGYSDDRILENHREAGFSGVITKPFRIGKLVAAVSQMSPRRGEGQTPFSTFDP